MTRPEAHAGAAGDRPEHERGQDPAVEDAVAVDVEREPDAEDERQQPADVPQPATEERQLRARDAVAPGSSTENTTTEPTAAKAPIRCRSSSHSYRVTAGNLSEGADGRASRAGRRRRSRSPPLVLARPGLDAAGVLRPRDLPDGLGLAGRLVEVLAQVLAALPLRRVDEEDRAGRDAARPGRSGSAAARRRRTPPSRR